MQVATKKALNSFKRFLKLSHFFVTLAKIQPNAPLWGPSATTGEYL
jgi:hypothetical protein